MSEHVTEVSDANFEQDVLQSDQPVLVDFWAAWCAPCRMLAPTVEAVAEKYAGNARVVKINVDENPAVSQRYGIKGNSYVDSLQRRQGRRACRGRNQQGRHLSHD